MFKHLGPGYYTNENSLEDLKSKRLNIKTYKMGFGSNIKQGNSSDERYAYIKESQSSRMKTPGIYNHNVRLKISHNKMQKNEFT